MVEYSELVEQVNTAILRERERCASIAAQCARGTHIEVDGEQYPLGIMTHDLAAAQYATAYAIMVAIDYKSRSDPSPDQL